MADVPRHRIFVKVCLVTIRQIFEIFEKVCLVIIRQIFLRYLKKVHLVDGVLLGDGDHPGRVARHVPHTNVASP